VAGSDYSTAALAAQGAADAAFSFDQRRLYVSRSDGTIDVFDVATHAKLANWSIGSAAGAISVSEDDAFLLVVDPRQALLYRVDTVTGVVTNTYIGTGSSFLDVEIVDTRTAIVTGGTSPAALDLTSGTFTPLANSAYYSSRSILSEDTHLTLFAETGISNGPLALYDDRTNRIVANGDDYQTGATSGFNFGVQAISESGGFVLQGIYTSTINIYDLSLKFVRSITLPIGTTISAIIGLAVPESGAFVYVTTSDGTIVKYDVKTYTEVARYSVDLDQGGWTGGNSFGNATLVSDDGQHLVVTYGGQVQLVSIAETITASATTTLDLTQAGANVVNDFTLTGAPGIHIAARNIDLLNSAAGRIIGTGTAPAIAIDAAGSVITNASGGVIRTEAGYGEVAIRGSDGSDTVINAGLIVGGINLLGGADTFIDRVGSNANYIDLGAGDDVYQFESTVQAIVKGGEGRDTIIVNSGPGASGGSWTGFEHLVVQNGINIQQFSGYQSINVLAQSANFVESANPLVNLTINGQRISMFNSSLGSIIGGAGIDVVDLGGKAVVGNVSLGGGDDTFIIDMMYPGTLPAFGAVNGGEGNDMIEVVAGAGSTVTLDLARLTGFETVSANGSYDYAANINLSNVVAPTSIYVGSKTTLTLDQSSTALLRGAFGGGIVLNAGVVVGRYGFPWGGPYDSSTELVQGDDRLSVRFVNHATVQTDIKFYIGDDYYDGSDGAVGGTIYGNAGNDTILGGSGVERMIGGAGRDMLSGNGGNDILTGGAGVDTLTGGLGADIFLDTAAGLNGDTITDFSLGDRIVLSDAALGGFQFAVSGNTLSYTGGTLTLTGGVPAEYHFGAVAGSAGGVELSLIAAKTVQNDFNGDGRSDIVWRNDNGALTDWLGQANGSFALNDTAAYAQVPLAWKVAGVGDFNGDGRSDIVWRNDNGALTDWLGQSNGGFAINDSAAYAQVSLDWKVAGVGDFNGDGHSDVLWRNDNGALNDWLGQSNGGFAINNAAYTTAPTTWKVAGVGDFNGDGRDDILWRNDNGALTDWLGQANGGFALNDAAAYTTAPTSWRVAGVGDFNGDGRDDILWRNDNGALTDWLGQANGGFAINNAAYAEAPTAWKVADVGDYNGDGRDDILWRNDNGALTDWLGQANGGFALNDPAALTTVPNAWKVADTRPLLGAAATSSADNGLASLHLAFAPEHVTADDVTVGDFASSRFDHNAPVMEGIW
jgi:hypothetical protein